MTHKNIVMFLFALTLATGVRAQGTTPNQGLTKPGVGSTGWGAAVNSNFDKLDLSTIVSGAALPSSCDPATVAGNKRFFYLTSAPGIGLYTCGEDLKFHLLGAFNDCSTAVGATGGDKVKECIAAVNAAGGGFADARGITGTPTTNVEWWAGVSNPVRVLIGDAVWSCSQVGATDHCIEVGSNGSIEGLGPGSSIFKLANGSPASVRAITTVLDAVNVGFHGIEIDGNKANVTDASLQNHCLMLKQADNVSISNFWSHDCNGDDIMLWGGGTAYTNNVRIFDFKLTNSLRAGVSFISAQNVYIWGGTCTKPVGPTYFDCFHSESDDTNQRARDIFIGPGVTVTGSGGLSFTSPTVTDHANFQRIFIDGVKLDQAAKILIQRNPNCGISNVSLLDPTDNRSALQLYTFGCSLNNVSVEYRNPPPAAALAGVEVDGATHVPTPGMGRNTLSNIHVKGARGNCVLVADSSDNILNGIECDQVQLQGSTAIGVQIYASVAGRSSNNTLDNARVKDSQGTPTLKDGFRWDGASGILGTNNKATNFSGSEFVFLNGSSPFTIMGQTPTTRVFTPSVCSNPAAAANNLLFTPAAPNASTITPGTYYYVYALGNEAGETLKSAERSVVIASGEAFQPGWNISVGDYAYTTGCPKMRFYVGSVSGGPYYLQTPRKRKVNLVSITRASNVVTAVTGVHTASGAQHGLVPGDRMTLSGVLCGGGACTDTFSGTFELLDGTVDGAAGGVNNTLVWAQTGANESGDASTGQLQDINWDLGNSWSYAESNYGNRGPIFDVPFVTSGTQPPSTNTAVIPALQAALNSTHSRLTTSDPDYFHGRKASVGVPEKYAVTLTTPLVMYETAIEGAHPGAEQLGNNSPLITSAIADPNLATVMVMGPHVEFRGVNVTNSNVAGHGMMMVGGAHTMNNFSFSKGYIGASASASATGAAMRLRAMPISFNWHFEDMNWVGGRWNIWSDRTILSDATIVRSRLNCGAATDGGAFRIMGGPDTPERATADGDGVTASVWVMGRATVTESCKGVIADLTFGRFIMKDGASFADSSITVGTPAIVRFTGEFWSSAGGSAGNGLEVLDGSLVNGHANAAATIKSNGQKIGGDVLNIVAYNGRITGSGASNVFLDAGGSRLFTIGAEAAGYGVLFTCDILEASASVAAGKIINIGSPNAVSPSHCIGMGDPYTNTLNANHMLNGIILLTPPVDGPIAATAKYFGIGKNSVDVSFYNGNPNTAASLSARWSATGWNWRDSTGTADLFNINRTTDTVNFPKVTGTPPFTVTSATPVPTMVVSKHPLVQDCGTTTTCSATMKTGAQTVVGTVALSSGTPSTATVTGISPAFTSSSTYVCTATQKTSAGGNLLSFTNVSGSSFTITGPATVTDVVGYICLGW